MELLKSSRVVKLSLKASWLEIILFKLIEYFCLNFVQFKKLEFIIKEIYAFNEKYYIFKYINNK